jgi:hypothetical protein
LATRFACRGCGSPLPPECNPGRGPLAGSPSPWEMSVSTRAVRLSRTRRTPACRSRHGTDTSWTLSRPRWRHPARSGSAWSIPGRQVLQDLARVAVSGRSVSPGADFWLAPVTGRPSRRARSYRGRGPRSVDARAAHCRGEAVACWDPSAQRQHGTRALLASPGTLEPLTREDRPAPDGPDVARVSAGLSTVSSIPGRAAA